MALHNALVFCLCMRVEAIIPVHQIFKIPVQILGSLPKAWEQSPILTENERTLMLYTTLSPAEPTIFSPSLCQTLLPYSFQHRQPHKTSIPRQRNVSSASQAHLPYAGDLESSPVPVKSSARREFGSFGPWQHRSWPLSLVLSQPSLQIKQEGNARVPMMSSSVSAESYIWSIFFLRYSNGKPLTVGHLSMRTPTPRPWGGCAWIRPRILIGTHQSPSFSRQEARSL